MRDIRDGLKERIKEIKQKRQSLAKQMSVLEEKASVLCALLEEEDERAERQSANLFVHSLFRHLPGQRESELTHFLLTFMADGRPWSLDRLKEIGGQQGVLEKYKVPGRSLHGALLNLARRNLVKRLPDKTWQLVTEPIKGTAEAGENDDTLPASDENETGAPADTDAPETSGGA